MNKLVRLGIAGVLGAGIAGCASVPAYTPANLPAVRIETQRTEGEAKATAEDDTKTFRNYKITDFQQKEEEIVFGVKKSEKEEVTKGASGKKEEKLIYENENAKDIKVNLFFWLPRDPLSFSVSTDSQGIVSLDKRILDNYLDKTRNKDLFFSEGNARAYLHQKLYEEATKEGKEYFNSIKILDRLELEDSVVHLDISTSESDLEGIITKNCKFDEDIRVKRPDMNKFYNSLRAGILSEINNWLKLASVDWDIIDAETRRPVNAIEVRFIPVKTKTLDDIKEKQHVLRAKYFVGGSDLFKKTEINPSKEFTLLYDNQITAYDGNIKFVVPTPSVYRVEFTDAQENARYRGFLTELRFNGNEKSTIELERIGTRVEIDNKKSSGRVRREK